MLSAARMAVEIGVPVVGVNRGRLGFLTDISPQDMETELLAVLQGHYVEEQRFLLQARLESTSGPSFVTCALNDVVVSRGNSTYLMEFDVFVNQELVSHYRADGIIFQRLQGQRLIPFLPADPFYTPL